MATTIQIKRGTGSAVPSGLADGELAINLDNGKLFFGSGSTSINSFRFENLTAENYIVSSSVTNITTQELSGSTAFGDTADDTHTFTGAITASGDISASGNVIAPNLIADSASFSTRVTLNDAKVTNTDQSLVHLAVTGSNVLFSNITASGNISGSATSNITIGGTFTNPIFSTDALTAKIIANKNLAFGDLVSGGVGKLNIKHDNSNGTIFNTAGNLTIQNSNGGIILGASATQHITASGNISSSGNIYAEDFWDNGVNIKDIYANQNVTGSYALTSSLQELIDVTGSYALTSSLQELIDVTGSYAITGSNVIFNHVTASGNISSSAFVHGTQFKSHNSLIGLYHEGSSTTRLGDGIKLTSIYGTNITLIPPVTASGNISSSGTVIANAFEGTTISANRRTFTVTADTAGLHDGDVVYFGGTTSMTTGAIYHYKSDGTWELADADAVATSDGLLGVALGAASDTNGVLLRGIVTLDHDAGAIGDVLYISTTAGDCTATAPSGTNDVVRIIGYKIFHATQKQVWFNPSSDFIIHA
jgi:hypothetical protein